MKRRLLFFLYMKSKNKQCVANLAQAGMSIHDRIKLFRKYSTAEQAYVLKYLHTPLLRPLLTHLKDTDLLLPLEHLDPDEATDIIQLLPEKRQEHIIAELSTQLREGVEILSEFDPKTAAGLMDLDYIQVDEEDTLAAVTKRIQKHESRRSRPPAIIVTKKNMVIGYLPGHTLGMGQPTDLVKSYKKDIASIRYNAKHDEVVELFKENPHNKVVVIGVIGNVIGIIYSDDILRVMQEQQSASLYDFAGVRKEESVGDGTLEKVKSRYKWLIINLGTCFLAAFTVGMFEATISKFVLLAVYMPIVAGMGGNAATQTLAIVVRGIALKQIEFKTAWPTLRNEIGASLINGVINGLIIAAIVLTFNRDWKIALVLCFAMITNLFVAAVFGTIVPLIMEKLGKDPATSATIFITTATDVLGFTAFLGLASLLL